MTSFILHLSVVVLPWIVKMEDFQDICGTCQNICHVELANLLTKCTLLVIRQIQDVFNTSRNKSSSLVLKPCKSVQEPSEEVLFIKARQIARQMYQIDLMYDSRQLLIETVSIENYKIQISRSVFHAYPSYLCRVSFLTTLDIYKDSKVMQSDYSLKL